jgi:hypothetical protein
MAVEVDVDVECLGGHSRQVRQHLPPTGPLGALPVGMAASTTEVEEDVDGRPSGGCYQWIRQNPAPMFKMTSIAGPWGRCRWVRQHPPLMLKTPSMVGPLGALWAGLTASTTNVEDIINGGPTRGHCRLFRQRPPPRLKGTSMAGPLGSIVGGSGSIHH